MKAFVRSFRGRLTIWSMMVIGIALASFSLALGYSNLSRLSQQIDRDLEARGLQLSRGGPPPRPQGPLPRNPGELGPGQERRPPEPFSFGDPETDLIASIRRPRVFDRQDRPATMFADEPFDAKSLSAGYAGRRGFSSVDFRGEAIRVFTAPWLQAGEIVGAVQVARELRDYEALRLAQTRTMLTLIPLALLVAAAGAFLLAGQALKPIASMRRAAQAIGEGDLDQRLEIKGKDELADLSIAFNEMAAKLELSFAEQKAALEALREAYESQRRFTADASHELRTPLARMQLATSSALSGPESGYFPALEVADKAAGQMAKLVKQLLTLARADAGQLGLRHEIVDLRLVASNAANSFDRQIDVELPSGPIFVLGDEDHLERAVKNLLENAVRHTPIDGKICLSADSGGGKARLKVSDTGSGIPTDHLPHIFERFYRIDAARSAGEGVGLGLAICKSIVEAHEGSIEIESTLGRGASANISLPLAKTS